MEWRKSEYMIEGMWDGMVSYSKATGYTCELSECLSVGITNKVPVDGIKWRPAGFWSMSILPEGHFFKKFKTKKAAQEFIEKEAKNLVIYIGECRRVANHGSVDAAHDEW